MKKSLHKVLSLVMALMFAAASLAVSASARAKTDGNQTTLTNAAQLCAYLFKNYDQAWRGPVSITKGVLSYTDQNYNQDYLYGGQHQPFHRYSNELSGSVSDGNPKVPVYLVCIAGTETIGGHANNLDADLMTGFNLPNKYEKGIRQIIEKNIPKGANLMIAGHSLGGMVAQQVAGDIQLHNDYNILYTVCYGAPCVKGEGGYEGTMYRLCDKHDYVTYLSANVLENFIKIVAEPNGFAMGCTATVTRDGGYSWNLNLPNAHSAHIGYVNEQTWGDVDVTGQPGGFRQLTLDMTTVQHFQVDSDTNDAPVVGGLYNKGNLTLLWPLLEQVASYVQK